MARFQQTLASQSSFEKRGRKSKREPFLDQMNHAVPWSELLALVEPFYPKAAMAGCQWFFGAKAHIGVDSKQTVVHTVVTSAASVADKHMLPDLLHGDENKVWGDAGYQGQTEAIHEAAPQAQDMTSRRTKFKNYVNEEYKRKNQTKARVRVRAKVEWPFRILKHVFGFVKVRYRGLKKNHEWLCAAFALVNLYQYRNRQAPQGA